MLGLEHVTPEVVANFGMGTVSFVILISIVGYLLKKIYPVLIQVQTDNQSFKDVIRNNTQATNNVATALQAIKSMMDKLDTQMTENNRRVNTIENELVLINERTRNLSVDTPCKAGKNRCDID